MTPLRPAAALLAVASAVLAGCGQPGGGGATSGQPAASSAPPPASSAPAAPGSDEAPSSAAVSALPPEAAAPPPAAPAAVRVAEKKREPTPAELLREDPAYIAREQRLETLYGNARERDPTGQVEREQAMALAERRACADRACLDAWFRRREAALKQYVEN